MRVRTADYQTAEFCYPLSAVCFPRERVRLSDFRLAWCLRTYSLLTAGHMARGDFSTALRSARNDRRGASDWKKGFEEKGLRFDGDFRTKTEFPS